MSKEHRSIRCWKCDGHGQIARWSFGVKEPEECPTCDGSGLVTFYPASGTFAKYHGGPLLGRANAPDDTTPAKGD